MKITLDKTSVCVANVERVKEAMKDFKAKYTDNDLLRCFNDAFGEYIHGEILKCDVSAYERWFCGDIGFNVSMIIHSFSEIDEIGFFMCDDEVNTDAILKTLRRFKREL